jgi:hypothetical protein
MVESRNCKNHALVGLETIPGSQRFESWTDAESRLVDCIGKNRHVSRLDAAEIEDAVTRPRAHRDYSVRVSKRSERSRRESLVNIDTMRNECKACAEESLRELRCRTEVHVRADDMIGPSACD